MRIILLILCAGNIAWFNKRYIMKQISLTIQEVNQLYVSLVAYRASFKDFTMPLTDSLIRRLLELKNDEV